MGVRFDIILLTGEEGRYRIEDVRNRTRIRSTVLKSLIAALKEAEVPLPAPRVIVQS